MQKMSFGELTALVATILQRAGMSPGNAEIVAGVVAAAERDAAHSHGVLRLPGYIASLASDWVDGAAEPVVDEAAPAVVRVDAANGFAQVALSAARDSVVARARENGVALLAIRNSHHFAALWPDVEPFAAEGFIAISCVNARSRILIFDAERKLLGTNPMAFACPRREGQPLVWDQASSVMAQGEVLLAARAGHPLPDGVGRDANGRPTNDPHAVLAGGAIEPFGGHKGSAIALMVEILAAALTGARFGYEDRSAQYPGAQTTNAGQCVILIDPARSAGADFPGRVEALIAQVLESGVSRLPAERRYRARALADAQGIKLSAESTRLLSELSPG